MRPGYPCRKSVILRPAGRRRALRRRRSSAVLTPLGRASLWARRLFPSLMDRLTYRYVSREAGSPFK